MPPTLLNEAVPSRRDRSGLQRARSPGYLSSLLSVRPDSRRLVIHVSRHGHHQPGRPLRAGLHHPGRADAEHRRALRPLRRTDPRRAVQPRAGVSYLFKPTGTAIRGGLQPHAWKRPPTRIWSLPAPPAPGGRQQPVQAPPTRAHRARPPQPVRRRLPAEHRRLDPGGCQLLPEVHAQRLRFRHPVQRSHHVSHRMETSRSWMAYPPASAPSKCTDGALYATMGHANARFFGPETGGLIFNSARAWAPIARTTTRCTSRTSTCTTGSRRADGGRTSPGATTAAWWWARSNDLHDALALTADQQSAIGFYCGAAGVGVESHRGLRIPVYGAHRIQDSCAGRRERRPQPAANPARATSSISAWGRTTCFTPSMSSTTVVRFTALNLSNTASMYNFLSPFSGTHWVGPAHVSGAARVGLLNRSKFRDRPVLLRACSSANREWLPGS